MPFYSYAYAVGHDQTSLVNVETLLPNMPRGGINGGLVPLGSARRRTLNQHVQSNGTREVKWFFSVLRFADFETLIEDIFGDFDTENADLTIDTRASDETYHRFNVVANRPVADTDYTRRAFGTVEDLTITFRVIAEIAIP